MNKKEVRDIETPAKVRYCCKCGDKLQEDEIRACKLCIMTEA